VPHHCHGLFEGTVPSTDGKRELQKVANTQRVVEFCSHGIVHVVGVVLLLLLLLLLLLPPPLLLLLLLLLRLSHRHWWLPHPRASEVVHKLHCNSLLLHDHVGVIWDRLMDTGGP